MSESTPHTIKLGLRIACVLDVADTTLHDGTRDYWPAFRGHFQHMRFETPVVGKKAAGEEASKTPIANADHQVDGWDELVMPKAVAASDPTPAAKKGGPASKDSKAPKDPKSVKDSNAEGEQPRQIDKRLFVYKREFADFKANEDFALNMNTDPNLHIMTALFPESRVSSEETSSKAAVKKVTEKDKLAQQTNPLPPHLFTSWLPLDCSPMFTGQAACSITFGDIHAALDAVACDPSTTRDGERGFVESVVCSPLPASTLPSPGGMKFLHITLFISSCTVERKEAAAAAPLTAKGKAPVKLAAQVDTSAPVNPPRLLADYLLPELRPMALTIRLADALPGITIADSSDLTMKRFVFPTPFQLLQDNCRPVMAIVRIGEYFEGLSPHKSPMTLLKILDDKTVIPAVALCKASIPRMIVTPGQAHGSKVCWNHNSVFCVGRLAPGTLREMIETKALTIELQDRTLLHWEVLQEEGVPRPELVVAQPIDEAPVPSPTAAAPAIPRREGQ
jgi:hypothetical protein